MLYYFCIVFLAVFLSEAEAFSDFRAQFSSYTCSILQEKCEWRQEWSKAEGVRRELDIGRPKIQFYHFCKTSNIKPCDQWVDEKNEIVNGTSETDHLLADFFVIENLGIHSTGVYFKFPIGENDKKLIEEIEREKKIIQRCQRSIDNKEPYDYDSMKKQIKLSQSKITTMQMKLENLQNVNKKALRDGIETSHLELSRQILKTQMMCDGADRVKQSLLEGQKNTKQCKEVEQTILELNEKLELLLRCAREISSKTVISIPNEPIETKHLVPVSGLLKIRVTGLYDLSTSAPQKFGKYASDHLKQSVEKKMWMFEKYNRKRRLDNDYIVAIHVGGKTVASVIWNEKKTISLCAIGTFDLNVLLEEEVGGFGHRSVKLLPKGTLHFQTDYNDPEQFTTNKLKKEDVWRNSISFRKSGSVLARCSRSSYLPRESIRNTTFSHSLSLSRRPADCLDDYNLISVIGIGAFGKVYLAKRNHEKSTFCAVKKITKNRGSQSFETPEFQVMKELSHPFICNLISSFTEKNSLYLVLDFCEAGDLHTHLCLTQNGFTESQVTYFACSIVLAVEYLHEKLYVHRDLKTENMMLTRQGYLKLIDFGLCRKLKNRREKMNEIVGTTTHLAAEIHRREPYGIEMDWWAVGVSLFQLRTRSNPFYGDRDEDMSKIPRISQWPVFHDLLIQLLAHYPEARLGFHSTQDVKNHPFFMDIVFDEIYNMKYPPPYVPDPNAVRVIHRAILVAQ
ncbi:unnamed protein product [Caenorhabditis angaria]|uniref:non-specific serine/threonine protein kinase n=1 Tax=Caenorhabditis angaria TaxID=860376 RepID=A0A9P1I9Z8_9PELO|nr:unnamed protein product [Caenorhabditis angaria]